MQKEMSGRVQSELRDAIVIIIFSLNPCSFVLKEMFGQVQSKLRDAIIIIIFTIAPSRIDCFKRDVWASE